LAHPPGEEKKVSSKARFVITEGVHELRRMKSIKGPKKTWSNRSGTIRALLFTLPHENRDFILIGKGSDLYKGRVSCQDSEFSFANHHNIPLVTALKIPEEELEFHVFLPAWIASGNLERHERFRTVVSFRFTLGEPWDLVESLGGVLSRLETRWKDDEKEKLEFKEFKEKVEKISSY